MTETLRCAIVGTGAIAHAHAAAIAAYPHAELVAVTDRSRESADAFAEKYGAPSVYDDLDTLLASERPDVVHVCTPPVAHRDQSVAASRAGAHVIVEKPPAPSLDELDDMRSAAAEAGRELVVVFQQRTGTAAAHVKRLLEEGAFGRPLIAQCQTLWFRDAAYFAVPWRGRWETEGGAFWGGSDYTGRIQNFELQLRAEGSYLFSDEGEPGFDEERLAEFWESGQPVRDGIGVPQQRVEEVAPLSPFDTALTASELTWDNFGSGYLGNLGEGYTELGLVAPPITEEGAQDLYLKPSMLHAISANTEHPEAAATLVNFLINSPQSGEIFGTNRGIPASETALAAAELDPLSQQIADYEASIADRLGDAPPVPIIGYGSLEETFRQLGTELNFGTITVDDAVTQFFAEMDVVLNQ